MCAKRAGKRKDDRAAVEDALRRAKRLVVAAHVRPDGDALGSMLALHRSAGLAGRESQMVLPDAVPARYGFLFHGQPPLCAGADLAERFGQLADRADRVVVVDTSAYGQLGALAEPLKVRREKVVVIDHHATADDVGKVAWRDETAAAAGVLVHELLSDLSWASDEAVREALAAAILTDTGWLRHSNTDARALRVLADLLAGGVQANRLYAKIYQSDRPQRVGLLAAALASLFLHHDGQVALMTLRRQDFARTGAVEDETEDFVNEPLRIGSVRISAILVELGGGTVRGSLRSRAGVDVSAIARRFGGGGHVPAAGFTLSGRLDDVRGRVLQECAAALGR